MSPEGTISPEREDSAASVHMTGSVFTAGGDIKVSATTNITNVSNYYGSEYSSDQHEVLNWLADVAAVNQYAIQSDTFEKLTPGTGEWITRDPSFNAWMNNESGTFWGVGIPGAGKTFLTSFVINHIQRLEPSRIVLFVYCRFGDDLSIAQILAALLHQCIKLSDSALVYVKKSLYEPVMDKKVTVTKSELLATLKGAVAGLKQVYMVVDALDELHDGIREELIEDLLSMQRSLFLTSREIPLDTLSSPTIRISASKDDLEKYIKNEVAHIPKLRSLLVGREDVMKELIVHIQSKSEGMFLLARLYLSVLGGITTIKTLRRSIEQLPKSLAEMYELTLSRITAQSEEESSLALRAFLWVTYAARPLNVTELLQALAVEPNATELDDDSLTNERTLISVCHGLIVIDKETNVVRLIHYTTHDFFLSQQTEPFDNPHGYAATICAVYRHLARIDEGELEYQDLFYTHSFPEYTCCNLGHHIFQACQSGTQNIPNHTFTYLDEHPRLLLTYTRQGGDIPHSDYGSLIHFASIHGLTSFVKPCLGSANELSLEFDYSPLMFASMCGYLPIVEMLAHTPGIKPNVQNFYGDTALTLASESGHEPVVRQLLDMPHIDVNIGDNCERTPLCFASREGHESIVQLLLHVPGVNMNACDRSSRETPLHLAAGGDHEPVVRLLLSGPGIDVNARDRDGRTPLHIACKEGKGLVIPALLSAPGIDINAQDDYGWTPLHFACWWESTENIVRLLLSCGRIDNTVTTSGKMFGFSDGCTPLDIASYHYLSRRTDKMLVVIDMLKEAGMEAGYIWKDDEEDECNASTG